jgi:hypothetical protein
MVDAVGIFNGFHSTPIAPISSLVVAVNTLPFNAFEVSNDIKYLSIPTGVEISEISIRSFSTFTPTLPDNTCLG